MSCLVVVHISLPHHPARWEDFFPIFRVMRKEIEQHVSYHRACVNEASL